VTAAAAPWFTVPDALAATEPPEARGFARDEVRLLVVDDRAPSVAGRGAGSPTVRHARFRDLSDFLRPGDLLVVNTSATLPAAVECVRGNGGPGILHFSGETGDGTPIVELRTQRRGPSADGVVGEKLCLPMGATATLLAAYPDPDAPVSRLWRARIGHVVGALEPYLARHGRPITYPYVSDRWPLVNYQTVFAHEPGSAEMPSAGRPFTAELVTRLVSRGVAIAPIVLHTGVSSMEVGEGPLAERFRVPPATARLVRATRQGGGRVTAVGTTVTRALETVASPDGTVAPGEGWTDLVLGPERPARVVDGIISGLHPPEASHLLLLEAVVGRGVVRLAYDEAVKRRYRWHEFGDSTLLFA
jgi:S-adenosylmethionine:tRNA ribosyltransferase-isomerase